MARLTPERSLSCRALFALVAVLGGCGSEPPPPPEPAFRVVQLIGSPVSDRWQRAAELGMERIDYELEAAVSTVQVGEDSMRRDELRRFGEEGVDLVFCLGAGFDAMLYSEATAFPDTRFVLVPGAGSADNVAGISFRVEGASYAAGVVAATLAKKPVAAILHGEGGPWLEGVEDGFVGGFRSVERDGALVVADGPEGAWKLASAGAVVALYVADRADPEVLIEAHNAGLQLVVTDPSVVVDGTDTVLAALVVDVPEAMVRVARDVADGNFRGQVYAFDVGSGVVRLSPSSLLIKYPDPALQDALDAAVADVTAGIVEIEQMGL